MMTTAEQIARILAFVLSGVGIGDSLADGDMYKTGASALLGLVSFGVWAYREYKTKKNA